MKQAEKFQSDFTLEELSIGMLILNGHTNQATSKIIAISASSVEVWNERDRKAIRKKADDNGEIGYKGIDSVCWYDLSQFNRTFKRL